MTPFHYHGNKKQRELHSNVVSPYSQARAAERPHRHRRSKLSGKLRKFCPQMAPECYICNCNVSRNQQTDLFNTLIRAEQQSRRSCGPTIPKSNTFCRSDAVNQHLLAVLRAASSVICFPVRIMGSVECNQVARDKKNLQNNSLIGLTVMH